MSSPFDQIVVSSDGELAEEAELSLLETLDHVLNRGLVIAGEITISVADVDRRSHFRRTERSGEFGRKGKRSVTGTKENDI